MNSPARCLLGWSGTCEVRAGFSVSVTLSGDVQWFYVCRICLIEYVTVWTRAPSGLPLSISPIGDDTSGMRDMVRQGETIVQACRAWLARIQATQWGGQQPSEEQPE